jgi:predicted nucleic acid-binding Zn ribbon protein
MCNLASTAARVVSFTKAKDDLTVVLILRVAALLLFDSSAPDVEATIFNVLSMSAHISRRLETPTEGFWFSTPHWNFSFGIGPYSTT